MFGRKKDRFTNPSRLVALNQDHEHSIARSSIDHSAVHTHAIPGCEQLVSRNCREWFSAQRNFGEIEGICVEDNAVTQRLAFRGNTTHDEE
jgi:hypothetical protein